ncbi:hypothetical protein [Tistrella mobilis]|uniref:Filamentation induced by cAMP protein Fic n=1 Tax=Tistrella mobilis (strain KA081020-065) TaxID=1110502 RepID=I3TIN4_TISMK|nr:hypothetical protein [Tistrella mobilis]AFK52622.1 filamentation induced by cAMP protein Fic [Tistrella mobilis KA081020-065]
MRAASDAAFPGRVTVFGDRRLPAPATPAGYAALIEAYRLNVPLPRRGEFQALTDAEAAAVEALYADIFGERSQARRCRLSAPASPARP